MSAKLNRTWLAQNREAAFHRRSPAFHEAPGEDQADAASEMFLSRAQGNQKQFASMLTSADAGTRERAVSRLGQERGNAYVQRLVSGLHGASMIQRKKARPSKGPTPAEEKALAERIVASIQTGGITVAVYPAATVKSAAEFKRQATQFAADHGALGTKANSVREGVAMELNGSLPDALQSLTGAIDALLNKFPEVTGGRCLNVPIQTLAIFTHGTKNQLQAGAHGQWIKNSLVPWVDAIAPFLSPSPRVLLYACSTAGTPAKGIPFAEALREALQVSLERQYGADAGVAPDVWGHTTAGHTTANANLVRFSGGGVACAADDLLGDLGKRLVQDAVQRTGRADTLAEAQVQRLEKQGKPTMARILQAKTGMQDPTNTYIREVPQIGVDLVWQHLSTEATPDLAPLGLAPTAAARAAAGLAIFQMRFQQEREKLEKRIRKL